MLELPDSGMLDGENQEPPFQMSSSEDVDNAARYVEQQVDGSTARAPSEASKSALPWLASVAGVLSGAGAAGAFLVSSVKITSTGLFVAAGPYAAGYSAATMTASLAMAGGSVATGVGVGAAVTAAIYFIPWQKLGSWLFHAFDRFVDFLRSLWSKIASKFEWLKTVLMAIFNAFRAVTSNLVGFVSSGASALAGLWKASGSSPSGPMKYS